MEIISGKIVDIRHDGMLVIHAALPSIQRACIRQYKEVQIGLNDGRTITHEQRKKAYALMGEISDWSGDTLEQTKLIQKRQYMERHMEALHKTLFSLSNCDVTTAREFISYLIELVLEFDIPTHGVALYQLCEDIKHYVYHCLMHKKCCVCGRPGADLHHVDRVGMGRNRDEICHIGMKCLPLCREHHGEAHSIGEDSMADKYYLDPIEITSEIAKVYKLGKRGKEVEK